MSNKYADLNYPSNEIHFDLDNTIAQAMFPEPGIGEIISGAKEAMEYVKNLGFNVAIFTTRPDYEKFQIEQFVKDHDLPVDRIICGKPFFRYLIDDRVINHSGDWNKTLTSIKEALACAR